jgi:hypothetical protein
MAVVVMVAVLGACSPTGPTTPGSLPSKATLQSLKSTVFGQQAVNEAGLIAAGAEAPVLDFTVEDSPPSIFVNWFVPDERAAAFAAAVNLPPGFSLAKVRILESDPSPRYWLSLNVYRVSGITTGLRAEWSTYVDDGTGVPRFMIIRARAGEGSIDPIGPLALPEPFEHSLGVDGIIRTAMNRTVVQQSVPVLTADNLFNSTIRLPDPASRHYVVPTREWVAANDFIYWRNGVNDRIFHNSTSHSAPVISVDLADVTLHDDTEWAPFVDPTPGHVLVYLDKLKFMIGPWWNVTEPDGRVDPATRSSLLDLKKSMYGGLASISALSVLSGGAEPVVRSTVADTPPSVHWHWRIPDAKLAGFEAALHLPPGLALTTVRLQDDDAEASHWLSLNVYRVSGASAGLRAEWSTYVTDGTGTRTFIVEARADYPALDPVNLQTAPYPVTHTFAADTVSTTLGSGATAFTSSFAVPPAGPSTTVLASREWVGAGDLRYWRNGVADRVFYDSSVFKARTSVDPGTVSVTDGGQWAEFVGASPDRVWVDRTGVDLVVNPWWNLNGLGAIPGG